MNFFFVWDKIFSSIRAQKKAYDMTGANEPVPVLSKNSVEHIADTIKKNEFDYIVEYGSGASTRFHLNLLVEQKNPITFISVERSYAWFLKVVQAVRYEYARNISGESFKKTVWDKQKVNNYLQAISRVGNWVPSEFHRLPRAQAQLKKTMQGWRRYKNLSRVLSDGFYQACINNTTSFMYYNKAEIMKDQYGESPYKEDYIRAGLDPVEERLNSAGNTVSALFIVDGGPRGDVVQAIMDLENQYPHLRVTVYVCEAQRSYFHDVLKKRETGYFIQGSRCMLDGRKVYGEKERMGPDAQFKYGVSSMTPEDMLEKEMWFYASR